MTLPTRIYRYARISVFSAAFLAIRSAARKASLFSQDQATFGLEQKLKMGDGFDRAASKDKGRVVYGT